MLAYHSFKLQVSCHLGQVLTGRSLALKFNFRNARLACSSVVFIIRAMQQTGHVAITETVLSSNQLTVSYHLMVDHCSNVSGILY